MIGNANGKKYTMIVFEEDERYGKDGFRLEFYANNPAEGLLMNVCWNVQRRAVILKCTKFRSRLSMFLKRDIDCTRESLFVMPRIIGTMVSKFLAGMTSFKIKMFGCLGFLGSHLLKWR